MRLFVGGLPRRVRSVDLREAFQQWGAVKDAYLLTNRETGESRCCGFVEMPNEAEALAAIRGVYGQLWDDREINCQIARERKRA
jgi:cold-inducible RNA-binding protein